MIWTEQPTALLTDAAQRAATQIHRHSPFAQAAAQNGIAFQGGKLDDNTCVVSKVVPLSAQ